MESISNIIKNHDHEKFTECFNTMIQFTANPDAGIVIHSKGSMKTIVPEEKVKNEYKNQYKKANEEERSIIRQLEKNTWQSIPYPQLHEEKITTFKRIKNFFHILLNKKNTKKK